MNITKIILCVISVASVGFAGDSVFYKENISAKNMHGLKPVKRGRPAALVVADSVVSVRKSKPSSDRSALVDVTNTLVERSVRDKKPNSLFAQSDRIDGKPEKTKTQPVVKRTKIKAKHLNKKAKQNAAGFANDSDHTTSEEGSLTGSRKVSFDNSEGLIFDLIEQEVDMDALNTSFEYDFDFDSKDYLIQSSVSQNSSMANSPVGICEGISCTPAHSDAIQVTPKDFFSLDYASSKSSFTPGVLDKYFITYDLSFEKL